MDGRLWYSGKSIYPANGFTSEKKTCVDMLISLFYIVSITGEEV